MAGVREDGRRLSVSQVASGRRSTGVLVMFLVAVLAAIALIWSLSRRPVRRPPAPIANVEPPAPPPAAGPVPAPAVSPAPADEGVLSPRQQAEIGRVIGDGRPGLKVCYQRALTRDERLVYGDLTVRVSIAPSGKVDRVSIVGPPAFRALEPCLETAISKWTFPAGPEAYATEFPLVLRGKQ
jgi:outer membrane biosynthesis protein TonB